jgi:glycosyltransferase involved in cell wall biosynthesis
VNRVKHWPFVSVIVPTFNRATVLPYLFAALAMQRYPASRMEVIVVDNSSADDTEAVVEKWSRVVPYRLAFYRKENRGPAASRNFGAKRARGEILAFTDSDCVPGPFWLRRATAAVTGSQGVICGPLVPVFRPGESVLVQQQMPILSDRGCYPTANLLVRRESFEKVGGFDERFGLYRWGELIAGEDADLAWRIRRTGQQPVFVSQAEVWHLSTRTTLKRLLLRPVVVQIIPRLLASIPELRGTYLWARYFLSVQNFLLVVALLGVMSAALTGFVPAALVAAPWLYLFLKGGVATFIRHHGVGHGLLRSALLLYVDLAMVAVLVVASVRYRRLVL